MADSKTLDELAQEIADQVCAEWREEFLAFGRCGNASGEFNAHVGPLSGGCRTCWPVVRRVTDHVAGLLAEVLEVARKGPTQDQTLADFMDTVEKKITEME